MIGSFLLLVLVYLIMGDIIFLMVESCIIGLVFSTFLVLLCFGIGSRMPRPSW